ncbi:MAG: hypothetical protein DMG83_23740 [Acidobacteria bacterium]|nr:MAG: hypothetical protein DMG83_23740 [Acidobacteriota bacterium]
MTRKEHDVEVDSICKRLNELHNDDMAMVRVSPGCAVKLPSWDDWIEKGKNRDEERQDLRKGLRRLALQQLDD